MRAARRRADFNMRKGRTAVTRKPIATTTVGAVSFLIFAAMVHADEIRVLSTQATEEAYRELVPQFEKASGHKVTTVFTGTLDANKRLAAGDVDHVRPVDRPKHQGRQGGARQPR